MVLYEKEFTLGKEMIDFDNTTYDEACGYVIYLLHNKVDGLIDKLYYTGFSNDRKRIVKSVYIYADANFENCRLCINYVNKDYAFVPRKWFNISIEDIQTILTQKRAS